MTTEGDTASTSIDRPAAWTYAWWLLVGALLGLGIAGLLTIGLFILPLGVGLAFIGILIPVLRNRSAVATMAGVGLTVLYLAWLNRRGPGTVCDTTSGGTSCTEMWSPWPFVAVAALLVAASILLARLTRR